PRYSDPDRSLVAFMRGLSAATLLGARANEFDHYEEHQEIGPQGEGETLVLDLSYGKARRMASSGHCARDPCPEYSVLGHCGRGRIASGSSSVLARLMNFRFALNHGEVRHRTNCGLADTWRPVGIPPAGSTCRAVRSSCRRWYSPLAGRGICTHA